MSKIEYTRKLEDALWELVRRWPDGRGYAMAIRRARKLLLEGALRPLSPNPRSSDHAVGGTASRSFRRRAGTGLRQSDPGEPGLIEALGRDPPA
jgi:hypothetical protein